MLETLPTLGGGVHVDDALAAAELEAVLVDVGALAVAVLRDREDEAKPNSQNGNPSKINPEKWHVFRARKLTVNFPAFTSNPPQLHHQKTTSNHPFFRQNPRQKQGPTTHKKITAEASLFEQGLASSGGLRRQPICPGLQGRGPWRPQPAQTLRLRRMVQGCPKTQDHEFLQRTQLRLIAPFYGDFHGFEGSTSG